MPLDTLLWLGFSLGLRHALDADHIAAVLTLLDRTVSLRRSLHVTIAWGLGHAATLMLTGALLFEFGWTLPDTWEFLGEVAVASLLVLLGVWCLIRVRGLLPKSDEVTSPRRRAAFVGVLHGLAGSGGLALLVSGFASAREQRYAYLLVFSVAMIVGMGLLTGALALLLARSTGPDRRSIRTWLMVGSGLFSIGVGAGVFAEMIFARGAI